MTAPEVERLGPRLREEREKRGVSLRGLAREVGVSASMISQIETGKVQPSVSTLYAITTTLGISVEALFTAAGDDARGVDGDSPWGKVAELRGQRLGPLVPPAQRRVLQLDSGVTWELLGELPQHTVDFLLVTYAPGSTSSSGGGLMRHPGSEYGHLLTGELRLTLGFEELVLTPGDSISFDSTTPHSYRNEGSEPAVGVWFVIERGH
ncbi:cupin domain-containing protein [Natronosporangium hydrolyticum]|uniref:Cupin domain-containing protein n=1 Tax=Natronosporangium hydrolyticum TaxID=2811111 RepID=A0A895YBM0_9ACTN|nr:cupin domain-containing protein [Natronosporangium hydrolyticum]QSB13622.1 cupin domain-containing protein [Natronosporangium hydrolyticum]